MKKLFMYFVLCLQTTTICGMDVRRIAGVTEEEVSAALERRRMLSQDEQRELDQKLTMVCHHMGHDINTEYTQAKELLEQGADANVNWVNGTPLMLAVSIRGASKIAALLLCYHADPNFRNPIAQGRDPESIKLLLRHGVSLEEKVDETDLLTWVCLHEPARYNFLPLVVWLLQHKVNSNGDASMDHIPYRAWGSATAWYSWAGCAGSGPLHNAFCNYDLEKIIALLQSGASLEIGTAKFATLLDRLKDLCYRTEFKWHIPQQAYAQKQFIEAIAQYRLSVQHVYSLEEYMSMGLSQASAELIRQATQEVNEAFDKCALDDWKYGHPGINLTKFVLDRQLGPAGRSRR